MGKILSMFKVGLKYGEREYTARMESINGQIFSVTVRAFNTADALLRIKNIAEEGSKLINIDIEDMYGNKF